MESIIKEEPLSYLNETKAISTHQHGFVKRRSCLTNLLHSFEEWTKALDEGYGVDVIYLDFCKAFDSVPHRRLLKKLKKFGLPDSYLKWIKQFLTQRKMKVSVNGQSSSWVDVISGVPQGSVLGPLLFLLYVNDLPDWIINSMRLFADDVKIWVKLDRDDSSWKLQRDLYKLCDWSDSWLLKFKIEKCKVLHAGHNLPTRYYLRDGHIDRELELVAEERDLGVHTTADLKHSVHCKGAAAKASAILGMIRRNFKRLDKKNFLTMYKLYVRPHLEYCVQAWSPNLIADKECLEKVQRRATKMVLGLKSLPYEERLDRLGLTTLEQRRRRGDLIETFKIMKSIEKIDYRNFFQLADSKYELRGHSMKLFVPRCRLNVRSKFFSQRVLSDWNGLPQTVIDADTTNSFKNRLDKVWPDMSN